MKNHKPYHLCKRLWPISLAVLAFPSAYANNITVSDSGTTITNDGNCTLPEAILNANKDNTSGSIDCAAGNGADVINLQLPMGQNTIAFTAPHNFEYGPNALPQIESTITIEGHGATILRDTTAPKMRLIYVSGGLSYDPITQQGLQEGHLTLHDLTLQGGLARGGDSFCYGGGGLGAGGAIFNQGGLTLERVTLMNNVSQGGTSAGTGGCFGGGGGIGGDGSGNGDGGGFGGPFAGVGGFGGGGGGGRLGGGGGGFRPHDDGTAPVLGSSGNGNGDAGGNGGGQGLLGGIGGEDGGQQGDGGSGSGGPGSGCTGCSNGSAGGSYGFGGKDGGGGGGIGGGGANGYDGSGGGFGSGGGSGVVNGSGGFGGGGGGGGFGGLGGFGGGHHGGGGGGMGGAIFNHRGTLMATNCTLTQNTSHGGDGSTFLGSAYGSGGSGFGGAIFNLNGTVTLINATLAGNTVAAGQGVTIAGNSGVPPSVGGGADGGALYNLAFGNKIEDGTASIASMTLHNTIVANSTGGSDLVNDKRDITTTPAVGDNTNTATVDYNGRNIVETKAALSATSFTGTLYSTTDPNLGLLADNGGFTHTMALLAGSPAIDAVNDGSCPPPSTDQRGQFRPVDGNSDNTALCDIGAYELVIPYPFAGFLPPIYNPPTVNTTNAGRAIPVKFSLGGNRGLNIFAAGSPSSSLVMCDSGAPLSALDETVTAGGSSLSYDSATDTYTYVWATNKMWTNSCRLLDVKFIDGTDHTAQFKFK